MKFDQDPFPVSAFLAGVSQATAFLSFVDGTVHKTQAGFRMMHYALSMMHTRSPVAAPST